MSGPGTETSGAYGTAPPAGDLISDAYQDMGVINEDETPSAAQYANGLRKLNALVRQLQATGIHVWTEEEAILFLQPGQLRYLIGGTTTDHCADANEYVQSFLSSNVNTAGTVIPLSSVTGLAEGMQAAVVLESGAAFWTTIDSVGSTSVTLTDGLSGPASAQTFFYAYTDDIVRPLRVPTARRRTFVPSPNYYQDTPLTQMMSREEYQQLPNKTQPGLITQAFYNPARDQGEMFVWPVPQNAGSALRFTWYRPIQIFNTVADLQDLPVEWQNPLEWMLARELSLRQSVPAERWAIIKQMSADAYDTVQGWDREPQSVFFGLSYDQTART